MRYFILLFSDIFSFKDWIRNYISSSPSTFRKKAGKHKESVEKGHSCNTSLIQRSQTTLLGGAYRPSGFCSYTVLWYLLQIKSLYGLGEEMLME